MDVNVHKAEEFRGDRGRCAVCDKPAVLDGIGSEDGVARSRWVCHGAEWFVAFPIREGDTPDLIANALFPPWVFVADLDVSGLEAIGVGTCPGTHKDPVRYQLAEVPRGLSLMTPVKDGRDITRIDYRDKNVDVGSEYINHAEANRVADEIVAMLFEAP